MTEYAVVHVATQYVSWDRLERDFVVPFTLGDIKDCVYIVAVSNIVDPLNVVQDYGNDGVHYFCTLPYCHWGSYFTNQLKSK